MDTQLTVQRGRTRVARRHPAGTNRPSTIERRVLLVLALLFSAVVVGRPTPLSAAFSGVTVSRTGSTVTVTTDCSLPFETDSAVYTVDVSPGETVVFTSMKALADPGGCDQLYLPGAPWGFSSYPATGTSILTGDATFVVDMFAPLGPVGGFHVISHQGTYNGQHFTFNIVAGDADGDGFASDQECDDTRPTINPDATEVALNGFDDDCNALTPLGDRTDFACVTAESVSPQALASNGYRTLNFNAANDIGHSASAGFSNRYNQIAAIGGPTFDTGSLTAVTGSDPLWTATISVSDTTGITTGMAVTAVKAATFSPGRLGNGGVYTVDTVSLDGTTFTVTVSGGSSPQIGDLVDIRTGTRVDALVTLVSVDRIVPRDVDYWSSSGSSNRRLNVEHNDRVGFDFGSGTVANITGSGPWTADITGLTSTTGLNVGDQITADRSGGSIGGAGTYIVTAVNATSITYTATGGTAPQAGGISQLSTFGFAEYRVDFLAAGTSTPVELEEVALSIQDIDLSQFVEFKQPTTFSIDYQSRLELLTNSDLALVPQGWMRAWSMNSSDSTDVRHWIEVKYAKTSSISLRLGQLDFDDAIYNLKFGLAGFTDPIECSTPWAAKTPSTTTYGGGSGIVASGSSVSLSATVGPTACTVPPNVTYSLIAADGTVTPLVGTSLNTTGYAAGVYEIVASYPGSDVCESSEDRGIIVIATTGDSTTGGGVYHVDSNISGSPRVHFGFTVQRSTKTDKRTGITEVIQRGQLLWLNNNRWRLKASLYSRSTASDPPVFGTIPCPSGVGVSGSNPKCGVIVGHGWLERWNSNTVQWERATDLGSSGWVSFTATIYDGGSVRVCKTKTCTVTDVADWFGMSMTRIAADIDDVPVTAPIEVRKQQNGGIVIRS